MSEPSEIARNRGLQTIAVWNEFNPAFTVGKLTLALHTADVDLITTQTSDRDSAKDDFDLTVSNRDQNLDLLRDLNVRVPHVIENNLEEDSDLFNQFAEIYAIGNGGADEVQKRAGKVVSLWKLYNTERAAQTPPLTPLEVNDTEVSDFDGALTDHPGLIKLANDAKAVWTKKKSLLSITTQRVDKNNKRFYEAWANNYPEGTPEHDALSTIDTEGGGALPVEQAVIDMASNLGGHEVDLHYHAEHATSFDLFYRAAGATIWIALAADVEEDTWQGPLPSAGNFEFSAIGENSIGEGERSAAFPLTVT